MDCLFCKIVKGEIQANIVYEDETVVAFHDIKPQAPVHVLVIPKRHLSTLNHAVPEDTALLGQILQIVPKIASELDIAEAGYRTVINTNRQGGQEVYHLHCHILGGRQFVWPPG